jgi:hypothetical protein
MRTTTFLLGTVLVLLSVGPARAFSYDTCLGHKLKFDSNGKTMHASTVSFPAGYWQNGISDTVNKFNRNPSNFRYSLAMDSGGVGRGNGESEIWGSTDSGALQGAPAIAWQYWTCYWLFGDHVHMDEVDVIFDYRSPFQWTADTVKSSIIRYTGNGREIQTTGTHELGHGLLLNHVNTEYNVMGTDFEHIHVNGSTATAYMGEDTSDGAVFLYGARSNWEDVGVVHWKYAGANGQYSDHTKTVITNSVGGALATANVSGETGYVVSPGQLVRAEFTYENMGAHCHNGIQAGYYISTNDLITTFDRRIAGGTFNLCRDNVYTTSVSLYIPGDLQHNRNYWLGVILDENNAISEQVESNNATYIPIHVQ